MVIKRFRGKAIIFLIVAAVFFWPGYVTVMAVVALPVSPLLPLSEATTVAVLVATPSPTPTLTPSRTSEPRTKSIPYVGGAPLDPAEIEKWVIRFTNRERIAAGMPPFTHDSAISDISRQHSENMGKTGIFKHEINGADPTDRALAAGYDCRAYLDDGSYTYGLSENIHQYPRVQMWSLTASNWRPVMYVLDARDMAQALVDGWMDSSGHKENILDLYSRRIGVGVYVRVQPKHGHRDESVYATQNFSGCE